MEATLYDQVVRLSRPMLACCEGIGWPMQASFSGRSVLEPKHSRLVAANHESVPGMKPREHVFVLRHETPFLA